MTEKLTPKQGAAFWILGKLQGAELPGLCLDWLDEFDGPNLRRLAGELSATISDHGQLFEAALRETGVELPSKNDACYIVGGYYASQILSGERTPYEGAQKIWWQASNEYDGHSELLLTFVAAASEIDDLPLRTNEDRLNRSRHIQQLEDDIRTSARELCQRVTDNKT